MHVSGTGFPQESEHAISFIFLRTLLELGKMAFKKGRQFGQFLVIISLKMDVRFQILHGDFSYRPLSHVLRLLCLRNFKFWHN